MGTFVTETLNFCIFICAWKLNKLRPFSIDENNIYITHYSFEKPFNSLYARTFRGVTHCDPLTYAHLRNTKNNVRSREL